MILDPRTPISDLDRIAHELRDLSERIDALANPTGTEAYRSVAKLQALVDDIQAQLDEYLSNDAYTKAQVDNLVANPPGNVNIAGTLTANYAGNIPGGHRSTGAYNTLVTGGGAYVAAWIHNDGRVGYAPSSRRFKTGFKPIVLTIETVLKLQGFYFQYLASVPYGQQYQREMMGLLAEDTDEAGFPWLVDYDEDGKPFGIRADILAVVVLEGMRDFYGRFVALAARVDALDGGRKRA